MAGGFDCGFSTGFERTCGAAADVPVQVLGSKGRLMRPFFDHILDVRPEGGRVREIQKIGDRLRETSRNEREEVCCG